MKPIPVTRETLVLRTDFTDDAAWLSICAAIKKPVGEFRAYVDCVSDSEFAGITVSQILSLDPQSSGHIFMFIVDQRTLSDADHPILVVDLVTEPGRTFRVIPSQMYGVEANLSLANMDFEEFANAVDADGVFRGF